MVLPKFDPPQLANWAQQLAGILPFSALIDFVDIEAKLHITELNTSVCLWNWPVTPSGARLLLSNEDSEHACSLDRVQHSATLHCLDGRYGDHYPSSTPTTTRLCIQGTSVDKTIPNESLHHRDPAPRRQKLEILQISHRQCEDPGKGHKENVFRGVFKKYSLLSTAGWILWFAAVAFSLFSRLYFALLYLICMPLTGLTIRTIYGSAPRQLTDNHPSQYRRLVVATESLNGSRWWGFIGSNFTINSLLNKPLYQRGAASEPLQRPLKALLTLFIASQWVLAIGACASQGWDALIITMWIGLCAVVTNYGYPVKTCVRDWLQHQCGLETRRIVAEFSCRRSLLSALVYLNPDSAEGRTDWIDPVLKPCDDRRSWEAALLGSVSNKSIINGEVEMKTGEEYWWKFIEEGLTVGREIGRALERGDREAV